MGGVRWAETDLGVSYFIGGPPTKWVFVVYVVLLPGVRCLGGRLALTQFFGCSVSRETFG